MKIWELSLFWNWLKLTYTPTLWRVGGDLITVCIGNHWEVGLEVTVGPMTLWIGYIGR